MIFYNKEINGSFIEVDYIKDNQKKNVYVRVRDINGGQDMQIGNFYENWYIRPKKMLKAGQSYKTLASYITALKNTMKRNKIADTIIEVFHRVDIGGIEYKELLIKQK